MLLFQTASLLLLFSGGQAQKMLDTQGFEISFQQTLNNITPTTDLNSATAKFCLVGINFDGQSCVINGTICPPNICLRSVLYRNWVAQL